MRSASHGVGTLLRRAALLGAIALLPVAFSAWIDYAHLLGSERGDRRIADAITAGHSVLGVFTHDDRNIEKIIASRMPSAPEVLALGSSRMQTLPGAAFPSQQFHNAAVTNGRLDDILGVYGLYDAPARRPKHVVLMLDPWTLSPDE
jgi:hypothetical protein